MASARGAAVAVDGKMVDRPVWLRAREIDAAPAASGRTRA
jgi:citrate lyase beta subunit